MQLNLPAALLPSFSATPPPAAAPRHEARPFSELLSQKQQAQPPAKPAAAPAPSAPPPPAAAPPAAGTAAPPAGEAAAQDADASAPANPDAAEDAAVETGAKPAPEPGIDTPRGRRLPGALEAGWRAARPAVARSDPATVAGEEAARREGDTVDPAAPDAAVLPGADAGLARFVADLHLGSRPEARGEAPAGTASAGVPVGESVPHTPAAAGPGAEPLAAATAAEALRAERNELPASATLPAAAGPQPEQRLRELAESNALRTAEAIGTRQESARDAAPAPTALLTGLPGLAGGTTGSVAGSAAAAAAPHGVPDFAHTLGAQVSVLAREGVQRAWLNLHGTEMGAVSVQIVMDGTQAQVHFGADAAATRDALQASLPELASALREAGLTLSGGDVSSRHARDQGERSRGEPGDAGNQATGATSEADRALEAGARIPLRRFGSAAGGIDLYA